MGNHQARAASEQLHESFFLRLRDAARHIVKHHDIARRQVSAVPSVSRALGMFEMGESDLVILGVNTEVRFFFVIVTARDEKNPNPVRVRGTRRGHEYEREQKAAQPI